MPPNRNGTSKAISARPWGAAMAGAVTMVLAITFAVWMQSPAHAQQQGANWWEGIQSFGSPDWSNKPRQSDRPQRKLESLNDLRTNDVPWRSEEMIEGVVLAIDKLEQIVNRGGWPRIPAGRMLRVGEEDERVTMLRKRLRLGGDLSPRTQSYDGSYTFDTELEAAVKAFQARHGLRETGRVDQATFAAINMPAEERLAQLKLNLTRLRELMQTTPEDRYILVNVPAFQLEAVEKYQVARRHRVIVGRTERQTPSVKATIKALNYFPFWRVPDSVAQLDLIPRVLKEPDYLDKEQIRVLDGVNGPELDPSQVDWRQADVQKVKFRQDPGPKNALGLVRIDMQNEHGVYMHDTPMKNLFDQKQRAFSAGCVRVQDVYDLADWIAKYEAGWDNEGRTQDVLESGQALDLTLTRPIPVYFTYITAWAEPDGSLHFRPDLYSRDGVDDVAARERDPDAVAPPATLAP